MLPTYPAPETWPAPRTARHRKETDSRRRFLQVAYLCGALPLISGVTIFLCWYFTRWGWLMVAGAWTLLLGPLLFLAGAAALLGFFVRNHADRQNLARLPVWPHLLGCAVLLCSNFPAAGAIIVAVDHVLSRYTVVVQNDTDREAQDVRLVGGCCDVALGAIPPRGTKEVSLWFLCDGSLELEMRRDGRLERTLVEGYVTNGMGGSARVEIGPNSSRATVFNTSRSPLAPSD